MELYSEEEENRIRSWSDLLPDMLNLISNRLPDLTDFARFRAVCKNWQSEAPLSNPPPQFPWILTKPFASAQNQFLFYSLSHGQFHSVSAPERFAKSELMGPATKYGFAADQTCSNLALFNPLSGAETALPPIDLDWCFPIRAAPMIDGADRVAICGGKTESKNQILAVCRPGDEKWVTITKALENCLIIFYKDKYFVYNPETGITEAVDPTSGAIISTVHHPPPTKITSLVESNGDLLGISCDPDRSDCRIYRLEFDCGGLRGDCRWVQLVGGIGDRVLFLDGGQGISVSAAGSIGTERNSIFCLESHERIAFDGVSVTYSLSKYDIGKKRWERRPLPVMEKPGWFLPGY